MPPAAATTAMTSTRSSKRRQQHPPAAQQLNGSGAAHEEGSTGLVALHRSRFVEWRPSPVVALSAAADGSILAAAREDGEIELWDTNTWTRLQSIAGTEGASITALLLWREPARGSGSGGGGGRWRLFSGGLDGLLTEWDLSTGTPAASTDCFGGAVWSMAAEPAPATAPTKVNTDGDDGGGDEDEGGGVRVAVACDDGVARLFTAEPGEAGLQYSRSLPRVQGRCLTVAWHPEGGGVRARGAAAGGGGGGGVLLSGGSDGCVHAWHLATGRELLRVTVGDLSGGADCCVWVLRVLPDGTIATGDSRGSVCLWDGTHGTQVAAFRRHGADVLALAASADGKQLFAAGVDPQVVMLQQVDGPGVAGSGGPKGGLAGLEEAQQQGGWVYIDSKRPHTHDVRCLEVLPPRGGGGGGGGLLVSGSNDAQLIAYPDVNRFTKEHPVRLERVPQPPLLASTSPLGGGSSSSGEDDDNVMEDGDGGAQQQERQQQRPTLMAAAQRETVDLWKLPRLGEEAMPGPEHRHEGFLLHPQSAPRHLLRLRKHGPGHVTALALSPGGGHLAYSDAQRTRLFSLRLGGGSGGAGTDPNQPLALQRVSGLPIELGEGGSSSGGGAAGGGGGGACCLAFSGDGRRLVAASPRGEVHVLDLSSLQVTGTFQEPADAAARVDPTGYDPLASAAASAGDTAGAAAAAVGLARPVSHLACSPDGRWLAAAGRRLAWVYDLGAPGSDQQQQRCIGHLPPTDSPITALAFAPCGSRLAVATADQEVLMYKVPSLQPTEWTLAQAGRLAGRLEQLVGNIRHLSFRPDAKVCSAILHTHSSMCHVDFDRAVDEGNTPSSQHHQHQQHEAPAGKRRRRGAARPPPQPSSAPPGGNCRVLHCQHPCLYAAFASPESALLVERPWSEVFKALPAPMYRQRYGT